MTVPPNALVISGPTAGGKSALALAIAREAHRRGRRPVEIVSADSVQVYKGFDIGSNKPSVAEQAEIPHHLVDIRDPKRGPAARYTVAEFLKDAVDIIIDIHRRGAFPVVVGGTGLYLRALQYGLSGAPPVPEAIRTALDVEAVSSLPALRAELEAVDPMTASVVKPGDRRRILRALGVYRATGKPLGEWNREHAFNQRPVNATVWVLSPSKVVMHEQIERRTSEMLRRGLVSEVKQLIVSGVPEGAPPFEAIGYRQTLAHVKGSALISASELELEITLRTRQYAKQQLTWWRSEKSVRWIDPLETSVPELVGQALQIQ